MDSISNLTPDSGPDMRPVVPRMSTTRADAISGPTRIRTFATCCEGIPPRAASEASKGNPHLWWDLTTYRRPGVAPPRGSFGANAARHDVIARHLRLRS